MDVLPELLAVLAIAITVAILIIGVYLAVTVLVRRGSDPSDHDGRT